MTIGLYGIFVVTGFSLYLFYNFVIKKMAKVGGPGFRIGYFLYTKTPIGHMYYRKEVAKALKKYNNEAHSIAQPTVFNDLEILPIAISLDNYSYLISDKKSNVSVLVDPADPQPIQKVLDKLNVSPTAVLTTHKHWDHSDGNSEWRKRYKNIQVYGGEIDNVPSVTHRVNEGDHLQFGQLSFRVMFTPGHTTGHVVYVLDGAPFGATPQLFSGDHLFLAGIGRMFECEPLVMLSSIDKVLTLPDETLIWPGHEYAKDNLEFVIHIDPENEAVKTKLEWVNEMRKGKQTTSPSTLEEEKTYNPFLRTKDTAFLKQLALKIDVEAISNEKRALALREIRERKDKFKYKL